MRRQKNLNWMVASITRLCWMGTFLK
jgi:hypothetical protein